MWTIGFTDLDHGAGDVLGRVYEYFLGRFAAAEGRNAGEFYTPRSVVRVLVEMLEPYEGRVFDPYCGSGGMFAQSAELVAAHGGKFDNRSIFGQEFVATTWRLAKMNLALREIDANLADRAKTPSTGIIFRICAPTSSSRTRRSARTTGSLNPLATTPAGSAASRLPRRARCACHALHASSETIPWSGEPTSAAGQSRLRWKIT